MRKEWMEPVIKVQEFVANEYVAACESGMVYKFECNAPAGDLYYYPKSDGKIDGTYNGSGRARLLGSVPITHAGLNTMPVQQVIFTMDLLIMMGMEYRILMKESLYGAVHGV